MSSKRTNAAIPVAIAVIVVVLVAVFVVGLPGSRTVDVPVPAPTDTAQPGDPAFAAKQAKALADRKAAGWEDIGQGLLFHRISGNGSGRHPKPTDTVKINYEGKLVDGTVFDSSWQRGQPATFPLGQLIEAWQMALPRAGVGDTIEIAVPPELGYGEGGSGQIPGNAVLLFKIELLGIE